MEIERKYRPVCGFNEMLGEDDHPRLTNCSLTDFYSTRIREDYRCAVPRIFPQER